MGCCTCYRDPNDVIIYIYIYIYIWKNRVIQVEEGGVKGRQAAGEGEEVGEQEDEGEAQSEERG